MIQIRECLKNLGYDTVPSDIYSKIVQWDSWYKGKVESFHYYRQYNGKKLIGRERATLGMAKKICEDWANLLLNEKVTISVADDTVNKRVHDVLIKNNFFVMANRMIELAFAHGTSAFSEYIANDGSIMIDYICAEHIFPLSWRANVISECAFGCEKRINGRDVVILSIHKKNEAGEYVIINKTYDKQTGQAVESELADIVETHSKSPMYQVISPNIVNNYATNCPMGISVFANAIDILKGIDLVYDSYCNEFRLGKKRIIVPVGMAQLANDATGLTPVFDDNDTEFYAIKADEHLNDIKEINMTLRSSEHEAGLQRNLNLLSAKCGLGNDRYLFERAGAKTATEVISEKSDLYQNLKKHEIPLAGALTNLVRAVVNLSGMDGDSLEVSVSFDDSIIEDVNAIATRSMLELQSGIIDKVEYLMRVYKLTEEAARQKVAAAEAGMKETFDEHGDI